MLKRLKEIKMLNPLDSISLYIVVAFFLLLLSASGLYKHQQLIMEKEELRTASMLNRLSSEHNLLLQTQINNQFFILNIFSEMVASGEITGEALFEHMNAIVQQTDAMHVSVADATGNVKGSKNSHVNIYDRDYFQKSISGKRAIEHIQSARITGKSRYIFSVPIKKGHEIIGIVYAAYDEALFEKLISGGLHHEDSRYSFVADKQGNIIIGSDNRLYLAKNSNLFTLLEGYGNATETLKKDFLLEKEGTLTYSCGDESRYASYSPMHLNDWIIFTAMPEELIFAETEPIIRSGWTLFILISVITMFFFGLVIFLVRRNTLQIIADHERSQLDAERIKIAIESTSISIWDYDIQEQKIIQSDASQQRFGEQSVISDVPESLIRHALIHPDSRENFRLMYEKLFNGESTAEGTFRVRSDISSEWWYEDIKYTTIFDSKGRPYRAIGVSNNVTEEYRAKQKYKRELHLQNVMEKNIVRTVLLNITTQKLERIRYNKEYSLTAEKTFREFCEKSIEYTVDDQNVRDFLANLSFEKVYPLFKQGDTIIELEYRRMFKKDNTIRRVRTVCHLVLEPTTKDLMAFLTMRDIEEEHSKMVRLAIAAERDSMTMLYNHQTTFQKIEDYLSDPKTEGKHALFIIDIDHFKDVNDTLGHSKGDEAIVYFSLKIREAFRTSDIVGRIGGDEFMVLMKGVTKEIVESRAMNLNKNLQFTCSNAEARLRVTASIGIYIFERTHDVGTIYENADKALYRVKEQGKDAYAIATETML